MKWWLPIFSILFTLLLVEGGFRIHHYRKLGEDQINFLYLEKPLFQFDQRLGFRYLPNTDSMLSWFIDTGKVVRTNRVVTNNHGHVSPRSDSYQKKKGEYRIAIVGDSLAACIHNDLPWGTTLEDLLNADSKLKSKLNVSSFKVLNLALDGIGVSQMPAVLEHEASKYSPDLVLVNFITADIYRRFTWRENVKPDPDFPTLNTVLNCVSLPASLSNKDCSLGTIVSMQTDVSLPADLKAMRHAVAKQTARRIPWFTPYPQFLSWALKGKLEEFLGRNPYQPTTSNIDDREESKTVTVASIRKMKQTARNIDFLLTPTYWEIIYGAIPKLAGEVMDLLPEIQIVPMLGYLPDIRDQNVINTWTNHPYDMHWSNLGARLYAQALHKYLRVKFKTERLYSSTPLPYN